MCALEPLKRLRQEVGVLRGKQLAEESRGSWRCDLPHLVIRDIVGFRASQRPHTCSSPNGAHSCRQQQSSFCVVRIELLDGPIDRRGRFLQPAVRLGSSDDSGLQQIVH